MSRNFLYRRIGSAVIVIVALLAAMATQSVAQGGMPQLNRPQEIPQEKPPEPAKPKVKGPRAVALLQIGSNGKRTLIPVAILVDGKFYDASVYKADPVPLALDSGTVYEVEQAGDSQGLFTVNGALHSRNPDSQNLWFGTGSYSANGTVVANTIRKAEEVPVGLDNSGDAGPPRLTRGTLSNPPAPASSSEKAAGQTSRNQATKAAQAAPAQTSSGQPASNQTASPQKPESYYRPMLRRGKPTQSAPEEQEEEDVVEPAPKPGKPGSPATAKSTKPGSVRLVPAISDAGGPDPQSYKFFWKPGEEEDRRNQMLAMAGTELKAYLKTETKDTIPANAPAGKTGTAARKSRVKPAEPVFANIRFHAFDLWVNNQPVMILSAEAHLPAAPGVLEPKSYSITLVATTDIYGNLRKIYAGVTDKFHLDVSPRLELIDVVDADGDGRGELLFRETTDAGRGYVIYRATPDTLWKMFDSLGEED
ncbi:MAG: hypothetical protein WAM69_08870 [Candidatus Sulfotelmatobacter sp.]